MSVNPTNQSNSNALEHAGFVDHQPVPRNAYSQFQPAHQNSVVLPAPSQQLNHLPQQPAPPVSMQQQQSLPTAHIVGSGRASVAANYISTNVSGNIKQMSMEEEDPFMYHLDLSQY